MQSLKLIAPHYLIAIISMLRDLSTLSSELGICVMPRKKDAETPDDFFSADVFPTRFFDQYYTPGGSPIYLVNLDALRYSSTRGSKSSYSQLHLSLLPEWIDAEFDHLYRRTEPFTIEFPQREQITLAQDILKRAGSALLQSQVPAPLTAENVAGIVIFEPDVGRWCELISRTPSLPIYTILSIDDNGTATVQLYTSWKDAVRDPMTRLAASSAVR